MKTPLPLPALSLLLVTACATSQGTPEGPPPTAGEPASETVPAGSSEEAGEPADGAAAEPPLGVPAAPTDAELPAAPSPTGEPDEGESPEVTAGPPAAAEAEPASLLAASLEAYESAEVFWEQGAFEDAFAALDRAYQLMAEVPEDAEPLIAQEKENLRHLISRRVVEIHASRQTTVPGMDGAIPLEVTAEVEREIRRFQGPEREFFLESYRRAGLYRPMIVEMLREAGLPEQLSWLPLVESGFKARALSRARALGLWQFISSTGYRYGLERSAWVDERMDPVAATQAAIAYLSDLHGLFGDWLTALAAYNCGEHTVLKRIQRQPVSYLDRFWDLYEELPRETRRYVPRFLATLAIVSDPAGYGFELPEPHPPLDTEAVQIERAASLTSLDELLELEAGTLEHLNPQLRHQVTPDAPSTLQVPQGTGDELLAGLPELPEWKPPTPTHAVHRVRRGETLSALASRYATSVRAIMATNRLPSAHRIWPGQKLRIPNGRAGRGRRLAPGQEITYRVRRGDNLWVIARRHGSTVAQIRRDNDLSGNLLRPGQKLRIRSDGAAAGETYVVRRGDTLGAIARHHGVSLGRLLRANHLSRRSTIYPGQRLVIPR